MRKKPFAQIASLQLPSPCRLLASACSPDKDLVALISRLGGKDRLSLWKMQGSKKWEVDAGTDQNRSEEIVGLAWSPSGQSVAIAYDPPRITLHSIQDGHEERSLPIQNFPASPRRTHHLTSIWWFQDEQVTQTASIPDIFGRRGVITGSAHSVLKMLPLLDYLGDEVPRTTATDLFAFQGSQLRSPHKPFIPEAIELWPVLPPDPLSASMSSSLEGRIQPTESGNANKVPSDSDSKTWLAVADDQGHLYIFLDGSYPLGAISLKYDTETTLAFLSLDSSRPAFLAHLRFGTEARGLTDLRPITIELPLLQTRSARDLAKLSSTARELVWYVMRVIKDMRIAWFGSESIGGAREIGPKWIRALKARQQEKFGQEDPSPLLDLTSLLLTGRGSDTLIDFLAVGEQMSDRGLKKWDNALTDALIKLRDFSEKRVALACQRLYLVLEEVYGWSQLPQYEPFELDSQAIKICLDLASKAIVIASWLAAVARREYVRFKEFIKWLIYETAVLNATEPRPQPRHDVLEVNNYFMSGLVVSSIDKWFMGPVPRFTPRDMDVPRDDDSLATVLDQAHRALKDPSQLAWQLNVKQNDLAHLDRNLDALIQELATSCQKIFLRGATAATRFADVKWGQDPAFRAKTTFSAELMNPLVVRERIVKPDDEEKHIYQYLAIQSTVQARAFLCLARMRYDHEALQMPLQVGVSVLRCSMSEDEHEMDLDEENVGEDFNLIQMEFFDDESIVIVYRPREEDEHVQAPTFMATVKYDDLEYQMLEGAHLTLTFREDLMRHAIELVQNEMLSVTRVPIKRCQEVTDCYGEVHLAVNGRAGRRVACVLHDGVSMEVLDMEGEGSEDESEGKDNGDGRHLREYQKKICLDLIKRDQKKR